VTVHSPDRLDDALASLAGDPATTVLAGGTDLMVDVNYGRRRADTVLSLRRVDELRRWRVQGRDVVLGATTTYTAMLGAELAGLLPALAQAARTVGGPQIRNTGTVGGNLATASPAGDTLPVLVAHGAAVELASVDGRRILPVDELIVGPKRTALAPGELIVAVRVPVRDGPAEFLKIGVRNAMVIAVASCALVVDRPSRALRCVLGAVGPVPIRDPDTEVWVADELDWGGTSSLPEGLAAEFGRRLAAASRPIDDHRATAAYRRHAVAVLARRALGRAWGRGSAQEGAVA
jgi:CO/xanthine dehydrogenase FAD-binding subunit